MGFRAFLGRRPPACHNSSQLLSSHDVSQKTPPLILHQTQPRRCASTPPPNCASTPSSPPPGSPSAAVDSKRISVVPRAVLSDCLWAAQDDILVFSPPQP
eukprot:GGOE01034410.1.p9 GENE.GGOE01034410.1~~GGOE01034410.1.p9  ORF type:complete len:100 (-),score=12.12 GGOE01034410.1:1002-1301(-)